MLKHGILGLLNYSDRMSGYEIMRVFKDSLSYFWTANTSQIYRELKTLKDNGFVTDESVVQLGKPDKNVFSITENGRTELKNWLGNFSYGNLNSGLIMKVFFSGEVPVSANIERFEKLKKDAQENIEKYKLIYQIIEYYSDLIKAGEKSCYWRMTVDYGQRYNKMTIEWCDECIAKLKEKKQ